MKASRRWLGRDPLGPIRPTRRGIFGRGVIDSAALAVLLFPILCCAPESPARKVLTLRLAGEPGGLFDPQEISRFEEVLAWDFSNPEDVASWDLSAMERPVQHEEGIELAGKARFSKMIWHSPESLDGIDRFELEIDRSRGSVLAWTAPGEGFGGEKAISVASPKGETSKSHTRLFPVAEKRSWRGNIRRLGLRPSTQPGERVLVRRLRGLRRVLDSSRIASHVGQAWWIDLEGDVRAGLLSLPGYRHSRSLFVPEGAELRFAHSQTTANRFAVTYRVLVRLEGTERILWEERREPDPENLGWIEAGVSLADFAGRQVDLVLETASEGVDRPLRATASWGHPQLWSASRSEESRNAKHPDILVISLDTLRADRMSLYGNTRPTTPKIDRWAEKNGVVFQGAVASAPWTLPSHVSMLSGVDALSHGVHYDDPIPDSLQLVSETLAAAGYATVAITENGFLSPRFGWLQGFDRYVHDYPGVERKDQLLSVLEAARKVLVDHRDIGPVFLFVHSYAIHDPYLPRQPFYGRFGGVEGQAIAVPRDEWSADEGYRLHRHHALHPSMEPIDDTPENLEEVRRLYDSGIAWTDSLIGDLLDEVDPSKTLVVLTSDHGESLGEDGSAGHVHLFDHTIRVPLVVALPEGRRRKSRSDEIALSVDIVPTVLEAVGIDAGGARSSPFSGRSLLPAILRGKATSTEPREAWSYSAVGQHGLSLRLGGRLRYLLQDVPWSRPSTREALFETAGNPNPTDADGVDERALLRLRRKTRRRLESSYRGLELEVLNLEPRSWKGSLGLYGMLINRVKTADLGTAFGYKGDYLSFDIAAGAGERAVFQNILDDEVRFEISDSSGSDEIGMPLEELGAWRSLLWRGGRLARQEVRRESLRSGTWLLIRWTGSREQDDPAPLEDSQIRRNLEALGYL